MKNERKRVSTRLGAGLLALTMVCAGLAITSGTATATQTVTSLETTRVSGVDVYATSAAAAISSHNNNATASVLVSGSSYADGLSAAALAGAVSGPVILTDPDALKGSTSLAIGQINSTTAAGHTVHIVGGTSAISADVATSLTDLGYVVSRHSGADRVSTADAVATYIRTLQSFGTTTVTNGAVQTTVFLTTARNFADAVAVNGLAYLGKHPILLVDTLADGTTPGTTLSAGTTAVLDSSVNSIERVIILGGTAAVSAEVETAVQAILNGSAGTTAIQTTRVGGADRYETAKLLLELRVKSTTLSGFGHTISDIILVNGTSHEDGMSATAIAGAASTIGTLLTDGTGTLNATTSAGITGQSGDVDTIRAVGRTSAISAAEVVAADAAATTATTTCSITAPEGSRTVTVTYSGAVAATEGNHVAAGTVADGTGAGSVAKYSKNNTILTITAETTAGVEAGELVGDVPEITEVAGSVSAATVVAFRVGSVHQAGDVFSKSGAVTTYGSTNTVSACSVTVVADTTAPTATVNSFSIGGKTGLLSFSETVTGFTGADLSSTGADTTFTATTAGGNYYLFTHVDGSAFVSGEVLTITAAGFSDVGAAATVMTANKTATASTDNSAPTATASIASTTITQGSTIALGSGGQVVFKSLATGVTTGTLGMLWSIEGIEGSAGVAPTVSLYDGSNRKIVVSADFTTPTTASTPTPANVCAAFNAHAEASAAFNCVVSTGNQAMATGGWAATATTGASEVSLINVTWSETMNPGAHGLAAQAPFNTLSNYDVDSDGSGTVDADETVGSNETAREVKCTVTVSETDSATGCATATGVDNFISGTMQFVYTSDVYTERLTAGTSALQISASSASDLANNAATSVTYKITLS